jgi:hypothetical protein
LGKIPTIENLFFNILIYSFVIAPLLFSIKYSKLKFKKTFWVIVIYSLIFFTVLKFDEKIEKRQLYFALYTFVEYILFALIFYFNIKSLKFRKVILLLSLFFIAFQILYFITVKTKKGIDTIPISVETILMFIFSFYFFYEQLKESTTPIYEHYFFWIAIGVVIYLSGSFFMYILGNDLPRKQLVQYWFINYIFDTIKNLFFVISGLVYLKHSKSVSTKTALPNLDFY